MKIEIGSGNNPQPGYIHVDITNTFPDVEIVCDIIKQDLPFSASSVDELIAYHVLEHVPWRLLPHVVSNFARVLKPGAVLKLRTPDLRFICEKYLKGETTPEWPGDESAMKKIYGEVGPPQWAMIKLFSGQDYASNFHFNCHDIESLTALLVRYGFEDVARVNLGPVFSPGELQVQAIRAYTPS